MYNCELNKTETSLLVWFWTRKKLIELMLMLSDDHLNVHWWPLSNVVCARVFVQCSNVQLVSDWSKEKHLSDFPFPPSFFSSSMIGCSDLCSDLQTFRLSAVKTVRLPMRSYATDPPRHTHCDVHYKSSIIGKSSGDGKQESDCSAIILFSAPCLCSLSNTDFKSATVEWQQRYSAI